MTPLEIAVEAFRLNEYRPDSVRIEAALTAYLTALSEDEATVELFAKLADPRVFEADAFTCDPAWGFADAREVARKKARAALTALASRDEK